MPEEHQLSVWPALGLWALAVAGVAVYGASKGYSGRAYGVTLGVLSLFLAIQLWLAAGNLAERLARRAGSHLGVLISIVPFLVYLIYLHGTNSFQWPRAAIAAAYSFVPVILAISAGTHKKGAWQDYVSMVAIFLPIKLGWLAPLWPYPNPQYGYFLTMLLAISVTLATFLFVRQFDGVGYNVSWSRNTALAVLIHFSLVVILLIPLGTELHFIRFDLSQAHWKSLPLDAASIFLLTAWPEEFLFRGLLQNSLSSAFSNDMAGWLTASVIFGLSHITNNGVFPNWRYALLATVAGIFYGRAWRKTNSIFTSALVHALVDIVWHVAFRTL